MVKRQTRSRIARAAVLPAVLLMLAGCGSSDATGSGTSSATGSPDANGRPDQGGRGAGGFGGADFTAIQDCLKAAGVSLPTPSGGPRGSGGARPSGAPNGTPPSGGARPSGAPRGGGGGGMFQSAEVQAALKACGITMPTGGGGPRPSATAAG